MEFSSCSIISLSFMNLRSSHLSCACSCRRILKELLLQCWIGSFPFDTDRLNLAPSYDANVWTMSPPCQPFSRNGLVIDTLFFPFTSCCIGNQLDDEDPRTKSLLVLLNLFTQLQKPPTYLMLENVSGFQNSRTRNKLVAVLAEKNYRFQEVMLSPSDIGIPNSRLRYFLIVRL